MKAVTVQELWGVRHYSKGGKDRPMLIGEAWDKQRFHHVMRRPDDPVRTLLFKRRAEAREWCRKQNEWCASREDCCRNWRFTAVRVIETVAEVCT